MKLFEILFFPVVGAIICIVWAVAILWANRNNPPHELADWQGLRNFAVSVAVLTPIIAVALIGD